VLDLQSEIAIPPRHTFTH